jgi:hypothetical protein
MSTVGALWLTHEEETRNAEGVAYESAESIHRMKDSTEPRLRLKGHGLLRGAIWHPWPKMGG